MTVWRLQDFINCQQINSGETKQTRQFSQLTATIGVTNKIIGHPLFIHVYCSASRVHDSKSRITVRRNKKSMLFYPTPRLVGKKRLHVLFSSPQRPPSRLNCALWPDQSVLEIIPAQTQVRSLLSFIRNRCAQNYLRLKASAPNIVSNCAWNRLWSDSSALKMFLIS